MGIMFISSPEDIISIIEREKSYKLGTIQEILNWYYDTNMILYSKMEILFMLKWYLKNDEERNILDYRVVMN